MGDETGDSQCERAIALLRDFNRDESRIAKRSGAWGCLAPLLTLLVGPVAAWWQYGWSWWLLGGVAASIGLTWAVLVAEEHVRLAGLRRRLTARVQQSGLGADELREVALAALHGIAVSPERPGPLVLILRALGVGAKEAQAITVQYAKTVAAGRAKPPAEPAPTPPDTEPAPTPPDIGALRARHDFDGLIELLRSDDVEAHDAAGTALRTLGPAAVDPLCTALHDEDAGIRRSAARILGEIKDARAVEPLCAALRGDDSDVADAAAAALGAIGDGRAATPLCAALEGSDGWEAARAALPRIGAPAVEPLLAVLRSEVSLPAMLAAEALGEIGDPRAVGPLLGALERWDGGVRKAAVAALERIGGPEVEQNRERMKKAMEPEPPAAPAPSSDPAKPAPANSREDEKLAWLNALVGQAVDIGRGWEGLPWEANPRVVSSADFVPVLPGSYVVSRIQDVNGQPFVHLQLGGVRIKVHGDDLYMKSRRGR